MRLKLERLYLVGECISADCFLFSFYLINSIKNLIKLKLTAKGCV